MKYEMIGNEESKPLEEDALERRRYPKGLSLDAYDYGYDENYGYSTKARDFNIYELWRRVRKHKLLIVVITLVITVMATIEMYRRKPVYQASTLIEVGKEQYSPIKEQDAVVQDAGETTPNGSLKTKIYIIKSDPLLEDVVRDLKLTANPNFWGGSKRSISEAVLSLIGKLPERESRLQPAAVGNKTEEIPVSPAPQAAEESELFEPYVAKLKNGLNVEQLRETQLLSITYTDTDPQLAAAVANGVAKAFIERNFEAKTEKFTKASDWLDRSTRELQAKVEQAEQALADYTRDHNIYSTDGKASLPTDKLTRLHDQALRAQIDRMLKQSLYEQVKTGDLSRLPESYADQTLTELNKKAAEIAVLLAQMSLSYGPQNPKLAEVKQQMSSLQEQIDKSRNTLGEKLKAEYERTVRDEQSLNQALEQAKAEASQQNQLSVEYSVLRQDVDTTKAIYNDFLKRNSQAKIQVAEQSNNVHIIQPAKTPKGSVGRNQLAIIAAAFFASLLGGIGIALVIEYFDKSIKTVEDVVRYTQLPALGIIPAVPSGLLQKSKDSSEARKNGESWNALQKTADFKAGNIMALDQRSSVAEAYRGLRTSVLLSTAEHPPKTILVVSGRSGEGKTTTVVNTAISLAQLGASVLIVDCDLRRPSVHKVLNINQPCGLSTFLSRDVQVEDFIAKTKVPNLSLLPCGYIPPNPAELLSSLKMKQMLTRLSERFDHIIIDSPPITNVTDPVILSTLVDGVILVVQGGKTTRQDVQRSCHELLSVGAKNFGVVLNNVDLRREGYSDTYFRYYSAEIEAGQ
jgi:polysaccharide biosynthesis transport protein